MKSELAKDHLSHVQTFFFSGHFSLIFLSLSAFSLDIFFTVALE